MSELACSGYGIAPPLMVITNRDDWSGVANPHERKKIQNRVNQRARRSCRRQNDEASVRSGFHTEPTLTRLNTTPISTLIQRVLRQEMDIKTLVDRIIIFHLQSPDNKAIMDAFETIAHQKSTASAIRSTMLISLTQFNIYRAMISNAEVLGMTPDQLQDDSLSPFVLAGPWPAGLNLTTQTLPSGLWPTALQCVTKHHPWIDLLPIPRVRDNILERDVESYGEEALCCALTGQGHRRGAGLIVWREPWDPSGWEVTEEFLRSWGWVVTGCRDLFHSTNMWRAHRGEGLMFRPCL